MMTVLGNPGAGAKSLLKRTNSQILHPARCYDVPRMARLDRLYKYTDREMTWTKAIILGTVIWIVGIVLLAQIPSLIIYYADQYVGEIIEFTTNLPLVNDEGLNTTQIRIIRDLVANGVQMGLLVAMLIGAYLWQEKKRKRTGSKGLQDVAKGYMPGK